MSTVTPNRNQTKPQRKDDFMKRKLFTILLLLALSILPVVGSKAAVKVITIKTSTTYKIQKEEKLHLYVKGYKKKQKSKMAILK